MTTDAYSVGDGFLSHDKLGPYFITITSVTVIDNEKRFSCNKRRKNSDRATCMTLTIRDFEKIRAVDRLLKIRQVRVKREYFDEKLGCPVIEYALDESIEKLGIHDFQRIMKQHRTTGRRNSALE